MRGLSVIALALVVAAGGSGVQAAAPTAAPVKVEVHAVDGAGLRQALVAQKGKVVLLNIWATTCAPCCEEFPSLVKLANTYRSKGVVVMFVSMDEPIDKSKVVAFVKKQKTDMPVIMRRRGGVDEFFDPVDKGWSGEMPTSYVFGRDGKQIGKQINGQRTYAQFLAALKPALGPTTAAKAAHK